MDDNTQFRVAQLEMLALKHGEDILVTHVDDHCAHVMAHADLLRRYLQGNPEGDVPTLIDKVTLHCVVHLRQLKSMYLTAEQLEASE